MKKRRLSPGAVLLGLGKWTFLIFLFVYAVFPVLWLAVASLKTNGELMANPFSLPQVWQFQNYKKALAVSGIARLMLNSVLVSTAATFLNVLIASMAAYTLSRFRFRGNQVLKVMFSSGILIPLNALMIPYFVLINSLGLYNTMGGLILVYTAIGIPISTFIIMGFMASVPEELEEAAIIDGACFYKRFFTLVFPLSRAGVVTAGTFQFLTCWNEFVYANLLTSSQAVRTVQLGIRYFTNQFATDYVSMYAAIIISILPSIAAYVLFQNQIIAGLTSGALKG
ncbi:MAG TPA: carbohydrate ABC transporter permease [Limnochordia bacterium]|nr:carbohydrate ABC transporter permease [Limnochordia bacterium]